VASDPTCDVARQDLFEWVELFCNLERRHTNHGRLSPGAFEIRQMESNEAGVCKSRGILV